MITTDSIVLSAARAGDGRSSIRRRRELAHRVSGGIEVTLYWRPHDNGTSIEIRRPESGERLAFAVAPERALDAFYHPFAHLPPASDELVRALGR